MTLLLVLFGLGVVLELALYLSGLFWRSRSALAAASLLVTSLVSGALVVGQFNLWSILVLLASLYRIFNCLRLIEGRRNEHYLRRTAFRTSAVLILLQALAVGLWWAWSLWHQTGHLTWSLIALAQLGVAVLLFASTWRRMRRTAWPAKVPYLPDSGLPTLTVAVPARNETEDLKACLESLVMSNYPKLEILVLDDCSQTRRTPEIIRSFAHDGVRFLNGEAHKPVWQPKNQAYDQLLRQANGEYVLFCGVDVRFAPDSLRQLMSMMLHKKKAMMSLLPWRAIGAERNFAVVQAIRYLWELAPPRRLFGRPPVLSTCWVAKKDELARAGGFVAVARMIVPEAHFAKLLSKKGDSYSFMRASRRLGIESTKSAREQHDTAIRMRYPQLHKRPENVFLLGQIYGFFMLLPFVLTGAGFWISIGTPAHLMVGAATLIQILVYLIVVVATRTGSPWISFLAMPFGLLYDLTLLHISMWKYEFSVVDWKGRNVCIPAMHVIPHLPKI